MSRLYAHLPSGMGVDIPNGGVVQATGDSVHSPTQVLCTPTGVSFGPLYVGVPDGGSYCSLESVTFLPDESDDGDGILFFGLTAGGTVKVAKDASSKRDGDTVNDPQDMTTRSTRRDVLSLAGATLAAAAVGPVKAAQDDLAALEIAQLTIAETTAPITIRVLDVVDKVLPTTAEILVDAEEARVGEIADPGKGVTLSGATSGEVSVYLRDSRGRLDHLIAWASGVVGGDEPIEYVRELPQKASSYDEGQFIKLSEHPALVGPVKESGAEGTTLRIGNTEIPHSGDGASEAGAYRSFDDSIIYEVGPNPPASAQWTLKTRLGTLERVAEKYF